MVLKRASLQWLMAVVALWRLPQPAAAQGAYAEVNGVRLYYEVDGKGPPLVLIHGWTTNTAGERMYIGRAITRAGG